MFFIKKNCVIRMSCNLVCTQINSIYFIIYSFQLIHISRTWIILPKIVGYLKKSKKQSLFMWYSLDVASL